MNISFTRTDNGAISVNRDGSVSLLVNPTDVSVLLKSDHGETLDTVVIRNGKKNFECKLTLADTITIAGVVWTGTNLDNLRAKLANDMFASTADYTPIGLFDQTITFPAPAGRAHTAPSFSAGATVDSGLPLSYVSSDPTKATVGASTGLITPVAAGSTNITVSQAGSADYNAATPVIHALVLS